MSKPEVEVSVGISVTNACYQCQLLQDLCIECEDSRTAKDAEIAYAIVEERNLIYPRMWINETQAEPDWWPSQVITGKARRKAILTETEVRDPNTYEPHLETKLEWEEPTEEWQVRNEYAPAITMLVDRLFNLEESITLAKYETICGSCHYVTNRNAICPNCN